MGRCGVEYTMKHLVVLLSLLFALVSANHLSCLNSEDVTCPQERIYNGCFCFTEWNDDNRVGNWTLKENWLQLFEPSWVSFVSIAGDNTVTVDEERRVNELYVGPNRWDTTRLVIFEDLTIVYDDVPEISRVSAYRLTNGQTRLAIQGKGFGFVSEDIVVTAREFWENDDDANVEDMDPIVYDCEHVTLGYRDAKIECNIPAINLMPFSFEVSVQANGFTSSYTLLSKYIK